MTAVLLKLSRGFHTLIDLADLERVQLHYWSVGPANVTGRRVNHYVQGRVDGRSIGLHRFLCAPFDQNLLVDHINGDGLDNRRCVNLRPVTRSENVRNRITGPSPLSLGILPPGVPIVPLACSPTPKGYSRARYFAEARA